MVACFLLVCGYLIDATTSEEPLATPHVIIVMCNEDEANAHNDEEREGKCGKVKAMVASNMFVELGAPR
jgi:hypothetical protein